MRKRRRVCIRQLAAPKSFRSLHIYTRQVLYEPVKAWSRSNRKSEVGLLNTSNYSGERPPIYERMVDCPDKLILRMEFSETAYRDIACPVSIVDLVSSARYDSRTFPLYDCH